MTIQLSIPARNARLDSIETIVGTTAVLKIFDGTLPTDCAAADDGTVLATVTLPSDWMAAAANGSKALSGTWQDTAADATGTGAYFRVYESTGTTCGIQGTYTIDGGGGDMTGDRTNFTLNESFDINEFTLTDGNA